mmetsp:Transcript_161/g.207  ORF Transcript_161/g.207 Transcript_161/m.207 type:complete len:93 (-) Transcript_161:134-412(-)
MDIVYTRPKDSDVKTLSWEKCTGRCEQFYQTKLIEGKRCWKCNSWMCNSCGSNSSACPQCEHKARQDAVNGFMNRFIVAPRTTPYESESKEE